MTDRYSASSYITNLIQILFGAITLQELGVVSGIILGICTFATNLYFKNKQEKRADELHRLQMDKERETGT